MDIQEVWDKLISTIKSYPGVNPSQLDAFFSRIQIQAVSPGFIMLTSCTGIRERMGRTTLYERYPACARRYLSC